MLKLVSTLFVDEKIKTGNGMKLFVVNMSNFDHNILSLKSCLSGLCSSEDSSIW